MGGNPYTRKMIRSLGWSAVLLPLVIVTLVWTGFSDGGFAATTLGWTSLALAWVALVAIILRRKVSLSSLSAVFVAALVASIGFEALSLLWTDDRTIGADNVERDVVYLCAALVSVLLADRAAPKRLLDGVLVGSGTIVIASVAIHLSPEQFGFHSSAINPGRLFYPLGYWNGQGLLAVMTILMAAAVVASRRPAVLRAAACALIPVAAVGFYFSESRGAGIALALGVAAWIAIDPRRLRTSVWLWTVTPWTFLGVWRAHATPHLIGKSYAVSSTAAGHRLAWELLAVCLIAAGFVGVLAYFEAQLVVPRMIRVAYASSQLILLTALCVFAVARYGTPAEMARSVQSGLSSNMTGTGNPSRLLSLSLNGRAQLWSVAWQDAKAHPLVGSGTGSYEKRWLLHRSVGVDTSSAHSLWLERFAEMGIIGLIVLVVAMLAPLLAAVRKRYVEHVPGAVAVYTAYLVHTAVDWDWLVPTLTLAALWTGAALLNTEDEWKPVSTHRRRALLAIAVTAAGAGALGLLGNLPLADGADAAARGDYKSAIADWSQAVDRQPWSAQPWMQIGGARLALGDVLGAKEAYQAALRRDPNRWDAWFALANLLSGDARAKALLTAHDLNPRSREINHFCHKNAEPGCINIRASQVTP